MSTSHLVTSPIFINMTTLISRQNKPCTFSAFRNHNDHQVVQWLHHLLLALTGASPTLSSEDLIILRPSYWAIFEKMGRLDNSSSFWYHTVAIPMWKRRQIANHDVDICNDLLYPNRQDVNAHTLQLQELCSTYPEASQASTRKRTND